MRPLASNRRSGDRGRTPRPAAPQPDPGDQRGGAPEGGAHGPGASPAGPCPSRPRLALAAQQGPCSYGPNAGLPELREAVAARHGAGTEQVLLGCGSQGVLYALFQAWLEPGDAVLVPDPGFVAYPILARLAGAEPGAVPPGGRLHPGSGRLPGRPGPDSQRQGGGGQPPGQPPPAPAPAPEALAEVAAAAAAQGILLLSDEVYRELCLGQPGPSLRDVTPTGLVLGSVSKAFGAPGLRVGWAVGDPAWLAPARMVHAYMVTAPARPAQAAALALLEAAPAVLAEAREHLRERWEAFAEAYAEAFGTAPAPGAGGFYHWQPLPARAQADPVAFCLRLRDEGGVVVVPGLAFGEGGRGHVRLSYAGDPDQIREGVRRLAPYWAGGE